MNLLRLSAIAILTLAAGSAAAQCTGSGVTTASATTNAQFQCGQSAPIVIGTENVYCAKGTAPEMTEGTPLWPATDDVATMPTQCIYTGLDATPSPGNVYTPASSATLINVLASANGGPPVDSSGNLSGTRNLSCGDTVTLTAGTTYTGATEFLFPPLACDGLHWITVQTSAIGNANFPAQGVRATPCMAGITNDAVNGRNELGYPDYACPGYPSGYPLSAKLMQGNDDNSSAASLATCINSGTLCPNHYRFIGIEFAKNPAHSIAKIVKLAVDGLSLGANHIIFDRVWLHGDPWTPASTPTNESTDAVAAKNSQWIALVNFYANDTYCNSSCVESHVFSAGTGLIQDGPFKLYNGLAATAGESWFFGGGGQGSGTPSSRNLEIRNIHSFKPLVWMIPIDRCPFYRDPTTKNLGEFKNGLNVFIEANVFENVWQGCQSDQNGTAFKLNPANQNNHVIVHTTFNGTNIVTTTDNFTHNTATSPLSGNPVDAANCPPGGCILQDIANGLVYRFCDGMNGCDQSGIPGLQCGTGTKTGTSCTTDAQCTSGDGNPSYCAPTTTARLTTTTAGSVGAPTANACVPGDCPSCRVQDVTMRFNEIYNATGGIGINTGLSSICRDQASGMSRVSMHDNVAQALSREMTNGVDPYSDATAFSISSNTLPPAVISTVAIRHNTATADIAVENGTPSSTGTFGNQVDHSDIQYLQGLAVTDNVSPGGWAISHGAGSLTIKGIGGNPGLANTYATNACQRYFTVEAPAGTILSDGQQSFTFLALPAANTNYLADFNGQWTALATLPAPTTTSFSITATTHAGDTIVVRDLNDCDFTFHSNVIGTGSSGTLGIAPNFFGAGKDQAPYPNFTSGLTIPYACGAGGLAPCLLNESTSPGSFIGNFGSWGIGRDGDFSIASASAYFQTASDAAMRASTGQSPGADFTVLGTKLQGVRGTTVYPALTITTVTLPSATHGVAYNAALVASFGASQNWAGYKSWWLELTPVLCGGSCGSIAGSGLVIGRDGAVNGPFAVLNISRTGCPSTCLSNYTIKETITGGAWTIGQTVTLAQFVNGTGASVNDGSFAGTCVISAIANNQFSCPLTGGVNVNIATHAPQGPTDPIGHTCGIANTAQCASTASFAPLTPATYTFWVGTRDGAFQVTRKQISATIN